MKKEDLEKILALSVEAPSGHNAQPWRFVVASSIVQLWNLPEKDEVMFNYKHRGDMISHGAIIENIDIISSQYGYSLDVQLFPDGRDSDLVAELSFSKKDAQDTDNKLFSAIKDRSTNRRPYDQTPLSFADSTLLHDFAKKESRDGLSIVLLDEREQINLASKYFSMGDKMIFQNQSIHNSLFSNVTWTLEEEKRKREGLFVKTKELSVIAEFLFKHVLSKWKFISKLRALGLPENSRKVREKLYNKSSMMAIMFSSDTSNEKIVRTGRIVQRLWLTATTSSIRAQPLSVGLLYLAQLVKDNPSTSRLSSEEKKEIISSYNGIIREFSSGEATIPLFSFRFGYADEPTARSLKKNPIISQDTNIV